MSQKVVDIVKGISMAAGKAYDGAMDENGDPIKIGEVIRDLFRKNNQPEQSYSERQMFQVALERLAREVAAIEKTDYFNATENIENILYNR